MRSNLGFLEQGLLVRDVQKTWRRYRRSKTFIVDCLSLMPLDYVLEIVRRNASPVLRFNRLLRVKQLSQTIDATETRVKWPHTFRIGCVVGYILSSLRELACAASVNVGLVYFA